MIKSRKQIKQERKRLEEGIQEIKDKIKTTNYDIKYSYKRQKEKKWRLKKEKYWCVTLTVENPPPFQNISIQSLKYEIYSHDVDALIKRLEVMIRELGLNL